VGVILDGRDVPVATTNGLEIRGANGVTVKGLQVLNFPDDGIEIAGGSQGVTIGGDRDVGAGPLGEGNLISGNGEAGIRFNQGAFLNHVMSNTITSNGLVGVWIEDGCTQNELSCNAIYDNAVQGIRLDGTANGAIAAPVLTAVTTDTITGTAKANVRLEFFSDDADEGRVCEGRTTADGDGSFSFSKPGGFAGPNVTATSTDASGNTSEFSQPAHLLWTLLLFLNGDNDLEEYIFDTVDNIVAAGPSPRANVLALVDGYTNTVAYSGTVLYDLTHGAATPLTTPLTLSGERNMGDGGTLVDFVTWGRAHYPARYTMLAIVDHGGGWAPSPEDVATGPALAHRRQAWAMGGSGLSWDFSDDYDYLDNREMRQALATITGDGAEPLDVLFYDVCLMGLVEVAYEVQAYATFFISSQNIGWAPIGSQGRYVRLIQGIEPATTPRQLAAGTIQAYADGTPPEQHPFTISAVDLAQLPALASAIDQFAIAISDTLTSTAATLPLDATYSATQKLDYDSDFSIEPQADGFVDLYDLALQASGQFSDANVIAAAHAVTTALDTAIVAEQHRSGVPWLVPTQTWGLDGVHGLSIFLPLGEDLEFPTIITETVTGAPGQVLTRPLRLRDMYTADQLQFVGDTAWGDLIETYYAVVASPVPTDAPKGPVDGLITPDITPPQTTITVSGDFVAGATITVTWVATDTQSGASAATLWRRPFLGQWAPVSSPQGGASGTFAFALPLALCERCLNELAVRTTDEAGNVEPLEHGSNIQAIFVQPCNALYVPVTLKRLPSAP